MLTVNNQAFEFAPLRLLTLTSEKSVKQTLREATQGDGKKLRHVIFAERPDDRKRPPPRPQARLPTNPIHGFKQHVEPQMHHIKTPIGCHDNLPIPARPLAAHPKPQQLWMQFAAPDLRKLVSC
jgi:hypothetical protein